MFTLNTTVVYCTFHDYLIASWLFYNLNNVHTLTLLLKYNLVILYPQKCSLKVIVYST